MVACLSENRLLAFLERRLPTDERSLASEHLSGCEACRSLVADAAPAFALDGSEETTVTVLNPMSSEAARPAARYILRELIGSGGMGMVYFSSNNDWSLSEFQGPDNNPQVHQEKALSAPLATETWLHVVLDVGESVATLTVANTVVATLANLKPPSGTKRSVAMGITLASGTAQRLTVLVDNVDCSTTP